MPPNDLLTVAMIRAAALRLVREFLDDFDAYYDAEDVRGRHPDFTDPEAKAALVVAHETVREVREYVHLQIGDFCDNRTNGRHTA